MYGKIFEQIYDGTLTEHWEALVTFQQMIILCDADGVCDVTLQALHRRTGIPVDILERGIAFLEAPDTESRSPESEGRRIVRIDEHRSWGWRLTNHAKYRDLKSSDRVREQNRERVRRHRERKKRNECNACNATGNDVTLPSRHTDTDTDQEIYIKQVFEHWKKTFDHPDARLDDTRRQIILARRTDGYEATHLTKAIDGCRKTPWNMGENDAGTVFDDITLIFESAKQIDRFIAHDDNPPKPKQKPTRKGGGKGWTFTIAGETIFLPWNDGTHGREYSALQRKFGIDLRGLDRKGCEDKMRRKLGELAGAAA